MLVVCRLALAALLILGPVFIVLALFEGTRGLFEGWLKSVAMFALVPLLDGRHGQRSAGRDRADGRRPRPEPARRSRCRTAVSILVASIIYASLMLLVFKVAANLTTRLADGPSPAACARRSAAVASGGGHQQRALTPAPLSRRRSATLIASDRVRSTVASLEMMTVDPARFRRPLPARSPCPRPRRSWRLPVPAMRASQLRYLHHRVAGASNNHVSREMLR